MQTVALQTPTRREDRVEIRPLASTDRAALVDEFSRLGEETRRRRFGSVASSLTEHDLDRLTSIDHHGHEALAAIAPDTSEIVGVARYIAIPSDAEAAEVAIEVEDDWQGRGIGRRLMTELADRASAEGITRLVAYVSADNYQVLAWIARAGGSVQANAGGAALCSIPLDSSVEERRAA